jgi:F0F1-type ATP synthase epsilon subunit
MAEQTSDITAGPGGVMTDEVGVVTGELTLRTELSEGQVTLRVQYKDADEWYAVTGGRATLKDEADLAAVHTIAVGLLNRPEG